MIANSPGHPADQLVTSILGLQSDVRYPLVCGNGVREDAPY